MITYMGIDCSTLAVHTAIINKKEKLLKLEKSLGKGKTFEERFPEITTNFSDFVSKINIRPRIVAIEKPIFIQNAMTTIRISLVVGAVFTILLLNGYKPLLVDNKSWKKVVVGKGNATKVDIKNFSIDIWGDIFKEQDFADASCIAKWAKGEII
tara:strand:- start:2513 stop:2974 length:462 start_codon:yes stop_codon:yes gene_type:complete